MIKHHFHRLLWAGFLGCLLVVALLVAALPVGCLPVLVLLVAAPKILARSRRFRD
jgi:hypothetical protein